jgi:hypothetical protein
MAGSRALRALKRITALHDAKVGKARDVHTGLDAICYAAQALASRTPSPVAFTASDSRRGALLEQQTRAQARRAKAARALAGGRRVEGEGKEGMGQERQGEGKEAELKLEAAMAPLNAEQARLNRARMLLYVRQFGEIWG